MAEPLILQVTIAVSLALPLCFLVNMLIGWALRLAQVKVTPILAGFLATVITSAAIFFYVFSLLHSQPLLATTEIASCLVFVSLSLMGFSYIYFATCLMTEASLHMHILLMILVSKSLSVDELKQRYSKSYMLEERLKRLTELNQIETRNGRVYLKYRFLLSGALICDFWKTLLKFPTKLTE